MRSESKYYIFTLLHHLSFGAIATLYVPYLLEIGLTYSEVAIVNVAFWVFLLAFEIPTGLMADGRGREWSIFMGSLFFGAGALIYVFAESLGIVILAELFIGLGGAFLSGASSAWIVDAKDRTTKLQRLFANERILRGAGAIIGSGLGILLAMQWGRLAAFELMAALSFADAVFIHFFMKNGTVEGSGNELQVMRDAIKHLRRSRSLRWVTLLQLLVGTFVLYNLYWTPIALEFMQMPYLWFLWVLMYGSMILSGTIVRRISIAPHRQELVMLTLAFVAAIPMIVFHFTGGLLAFIALILVYEVCLGAIGPLVQSYVHERIQSSFRATFESIQSFVVSIGRVSALSIASFAFVGQTEDIETIAAMWLVAGVVIVTSFVVLWLARVKE